MHYAYSWCFFKTKVFKTKSLPSIKFGESLTLKILRICKDDMMNEMNLEAS